MNHLSQCFVSYSIVNFHVIVFTPLFLTSMFITLIIFHVIIFYSSVFPIGSLIYHHYIYLQSPPLLLAFQIGFQLYLNALASFSSVLGI